MQSSSRWNLSDPTVSNIASSTSAVDQPLPHSVVSSSHRQQYPQQEQQQAFDVPALSDLLSVVGSESRIDMPLFNLLSGIVAAVEVTNDKVQDLSSQYQELSLEVATISRVIQSNQLEVVVAASATTANKKADMSSTSASPSSPAAGTSFSKGGGRSHSRTNSGTNNNSNKTNTNNNNSQHQNAAKQQNPATTSSAISQPLTPHQLQRKAAADSALASESVHALHSHAIADLENRIDSLAVKIGRLQEDVGIKTREAMEKAYTDVVEVCDVERRRTEDSMRALSRTFEGQNAVRLAELFAGGEAKLMKVAEEAYTNLRACGEELATSFAQTGRGFLDSSREAATAMMSTVTSSCADIIQHAREAATESSHAVIAQNFETESRMLWMFQAVEKLFLNARNMNQNNNNNNNNDNNNNNNNNNHTAAAASTRSNHHRDADTAAVATMSSPPAIFRCCSAVEQIRALYCVLGVDGAEAVRIFKAHYTSSSGLFSSGGDSDYNNSVTTTTNRALTRGEVDALNLMLRTPMFRSLDPLPSLGLRVSDAPPPTEGAEVVFCDPNGRASQAGLRVGDIILRVDGRDLGSGAASRGGLHLALLIAPNRPLPLGMRPIEDHYSPDENVNNNNNSTSNDAVATPKSGSSPAASSSSSSSPALLKARWAPEVPKPEAAALKMEFNAQRTRTRRHSFGSGRSSRSSGGGGVVLTVYRYRDALTFSTTINLDAIL